MKILLITNDFPPRVGGVNYYVDHIVRSFPPGDVTVLAPAWPGARAHDAAYPQEVIRWRSRILLPLPPLRALAADIARAVPADVVVFGAAIPFAAIGREIRRRTGVPYAAFTHGAEVGWGRLPGGRALLARIARDAVLLTAVSDWTRQVLRGIVGPGTRIELLPPGVDTRAFHPGVDGTGMRARHRLGDGPVVSCVSRLIVRKGQDRLIEALPRLAEEFPGVRLLLVGSGPYGGRLRRLARTLPDPERVVFAGQAPPEELPSYFAAGDVFAMPCRSRYLGLEVEGIGAVYLQALAVGRACVVGSSGGAPEAARGGLTGVVVDGRDPRAVAEGIARTLRDPEGTAKMGTIGAEWVHAELNWGALSARLRTLLSESLSESGG